MLNSYLFLPVIRLQAEDNERRAQRLGTQLAALRERGRQPAPGPARAGEAVTVRFAAEHDTSALAHIAELDSASLPCAPLLVGERSGRPVAALSLRDGAVVANPFAATADVVALLRLRARQLRREAPSAGRRRRATAWRLLRAGDV